MIVKKYNVQLRTIKESDLELIRTHRNSEIIRSKMVYRDFITRQQQIEWFNSISNFNNLYYLIHWEGNPVGLINDKNIDWHELTSEAGLFIWDKTIEHSIVPAYATLCLLELGFEMLYWNKTYIRVIEKNQGALQYNKHVGFVPVKSKDGIVEMELNRENYLLKTRKLIVSQTKLTDDKKLQIIVESNDTEFIKNVLMVKERFRVPVETFQGENLTYFVYSLYV